jgi:hypothetical protein
MPAEAQVLGLEFVVNVEHQVIVEVTINARLRNSNGTRQSDLQLWQWRAEEILLRRR